MKYQGFYDYAFDENGNPDRTYTAKQFREHLKALFGSGIAITNATGDDAWKVEKVGDLQIKVTLGKNKYNFASLDGNPFAVDEEITFPISQGTSRWDSIVIRADYSQDVRATDVTVKENSISYTRNDTIYELRIARIHVENNVITEVIDDRWDIESCGIADGLVTVPLDELRKLIEDVKSGSIFAMKDGTLQANLNSEMLDGKKFEEIKSEINKNISYAIAGKPIVTETEISGTENILEGEQSEWQIKDDGILHFEATLANEYKCDVKAYQANGSISKVWASSNTAYEKDGAKVWSDANYNGERYIKYEFENPIKIQKAKIKIGTTSSSSITDVAAYIQGSNDNSSWTTLVTISQSKIHSETDTTNATEYTFSNQNFYKYYKIWMQDSASRFYYYVYSFYVSEYQYKFADYDFPIEQNIQELQELQKLFVKTTEIDFSSGTITRTVSINAIPVDTMLYPNELYEFIFDKNNNKLLNTSLYPYITGTLSSGAYIDFERTPAFAMGISDVFVGSATYKSTYLVAPQIEGNRVTNTSQYAVDYIAFFDKGGR